MLPGGLTQIDVLTYDKIKGRRYAYIRQLNRPDDYMEIVYVTERTPDDCNWELLVSGIEAQHNDGAVPMQQMTQAKMLLNAAEKEFYNTFWFRKMFFYNS